MALIRWQPMRQLGTLRQQMDRLFDDLLSDTELGGLSLRDFPAWSSIEGTTWMPAIELQDTEKDVILKAEIPGVEAKDLDVQVGREAVSIAGEHQQKEEKEEKGIFRSEFRYGKFQRVVPLPTQIHNDRVKAEFKDGILTLTMPKVEEAAQKKVKVNLTGS